MSFPRVGFRQYSRPALSGRYVAALLLRRLKLNLHLDYLKESDFYDDLDHVIRCFDKTTKLRFNNDQQPQYIKFGGTRDNDASCNIRFGQLKLAGYVHTEFIASTTRAHTTLYRSEVASFFEPSVKCIVDSVLDMIKNGHQKIKVSTIYETNHQR
jgi:hypothetical protein